MLWCGEILWTSIITILYLSFSFLRQLKCISQYCPSHGESCVHATLRVSEACFDTTCFQAWIALYSPASVPYWFFVSTESLHWCFLSSFVPPFPHPESMSHNSSGLNKLQYLLYIHLSFKNTKLSRTDSSLRQAHCFVTSGSCMYLSLAGQASGVPSSMEDWQPCRIAPCRSVKSFV